MDLKKLTEFALRNVHVQESLEIIEKAIDRYSLDNVAVSFNGGKDCTAVLHLVHSVTQKLNANNNDCRVQAFYAQLPNYFEEESKFVTETVEYYNLRLLQYSNNSLKESLVKLKNDHPNIGAIFVGTRHSDLKSGVQFGAFEPTDNEWPVFMRVNPIIKWSYKQVWDYIREFSIPYCPLYDQGYSSLGTHKDTIRNSSLIRFNGNGEPYYLPAWSLAEGEERLSRN